ncbi:MAG: polyketide synthase, partial [Acidobacteriaceae bacterium]
MTNFDDFRQRIEKLSPKRLALLALEMHAKLQHVERQQNEPIAIVGMGCRIPGAEAGPEAFWELLRKGSDAIGEVPSERWDSAAYYDPDPDVPGRISTRWGGFLSQIDCFDAAFFGIAGREAISMDPQQRLLLEVCWEALENAGYSPRGLKGTQTGVFIGIGSTDYHRILLERGENAIDAYLASGSSPAIAAGRISYTMGLHGPSLAVDTACSASLVSVHLACQSLRGRECHIALAGGVNAVLLP